MERILDFYPFWPNFSLLTFIAYATLEQRNILSI